MEQETYSYTASEAIGMCAVHTTLHINMQVVAVYVAPSCKYKFLIKKIKYNIKFTRHALDDNYIIALQHEVHSELCNKLQ